MSNIVYYSYIFVNVFLPMKGVKRSIVMDKITRRSLAKGITESFTTFHQKFVREVSFTLPANHCLTLCILNDRGTQTISELSEKLLMSKQQMSPIIDKLCKASFVKREQDPNDRRNSNITILPAGYAVIEEHRENMIDLLDRKLEHLEDTDIIEFQKALKVCFGIFHKIG
ncbi:MAG: hypothetical protein K0Q53_1567 [Massilibacillus sp.]|nr:hypothetical protein [Massilibacillus sp.]